IDLSIPNKNGCAALQHTREPRRAKKHTHYKPVDCQQAECADDPSRDGIVISNDRVLHRIRERQQNDEIEWIQLCQFAFAKEAQQQNQYEVDNDRTKQLLNDWKRQLKHVVEDLRKRHAPEHSWNQRFCSSTNVRSTTCVLSFGCMKYLQLTPENTCSCAGLTPWVAKNERIESSLKIDPADIFHAARIAARSSSVTLSIVRAPIV